MRAARHMLCCTLLGGLLFGAERRLAAPPPLAVDAAEVAAAARAAGLVEPTGATLASFAASTRDEELLAREAQRRGLGRGDVLVQDALGRSRDFLAAGAAPIGGEALGAPDPPAVRRHLAARLAAQIRAEAAVAPVDERALRAWYGRERARFAIPATLRLAQAFFAGPDAGARAAAARARIERGALDPVRAAALGDPSLFGAELAPIAEAQLAARLGAPLARAAFAAPVGIWIGPIRSSQGAHLLFVRERREARVAGFAEARGAIESAWRTERGEAALAAALARLRGESELPRG